MKSKVAYFGVFTTLALIFSYVETLIPIQFGIPGVKLGLANLIIVIALYRMKLSEAYLLSIVRVLLAGFIFGNYFSIIYSLAGGLLSLTVMALLRKKGGFSVIGVSIAGGVFRTADHRIRDRGDFQRDVLCSGASDCGAGDRSSDRYRLRRNVEATCQFGILGGNL